LPRPGADLGGEPGTDGVRGDVRAEDAQVALVVDDARGEACAEEVAVPAMTLVERLRVASVQELHPA
jgi:hypothetical protein